MSAATSSRSPAGTGRGRLLVRGTVYAVALLAGAVVGATLILIALDGHPVGLLTIPAGAAVPVILWSMWKLQHSTHGLLQRRRYLLSALQHLPAGTTIVDETGTANAELTITLLPGARETRDDIHLTAEPGSNVQVTIAGDSVTVARDNVGLGSDPLDAAEFTDDVLEEAIQRLQTVGSSQSIREAVHGLRVMGYTLGLPKTIPGKRPENYLRIMDPKDTAHSVGYLTPSAFSFNRTSDRERLKDLPGARPISDAVNFTHAQSAQPGLAAANLLKTDDTLSTASSQILRNLLTIHPEAESLLAEASHYRALAISSAARVGREFAAAQAARLGYEELRQRIDSRRRRSIHFGTGMFFLAVLGTGLTVLNALELRALVPGVRSVFLALGATTVWLTLAWLAAIACRERRRALVAATGVGAILLGLLLAAVHDADPRQTWPAALEHIRGSPVFDVLVGVSLITVGVGAAILIAHVEPASLYVARRRWRQARASHEAAILVQVADAEAASVAAAVWLNLVRHQASAAAGGDEHVVQETVARASALL